MKRILWKLAGVLVLLGTLSCVGVCASLRAPLPTTGTQGPEAEALTDRILEAVNHPAWLAVGAVQWRLGPGPLFTWDRRGDRFRLDDPKKKRVVWMDIATQTGVVEDDGQRLEGKKLKAALEKTWARFLNDRFWLNPLEQVRAPGTARSLVTLDDGRAALLVDYSSGGVTPGDSYLWIPGPDGKPEAWRIWVSAIPLPGLKITWEGWTEVAGAWISTEHDATVLSFHIGDLRAGADLAAIDEADAFAGVP